MALQLHLKFDETTGTTANDSSGQGRHGTLSVAGSWQQGVLNNCLAYPTANGSGKFPRELKIPGSVDISSGIMMDEGKLINPNQYKII